MFENLFDGLTDLNGDGVIDGLDMDIAMNMEQADIFGGNDLGINAAHDVSFGGLGSFIGDIGEALARPSMASDLIQIAQDKIGDIADGIHDALFGGDTVDAAQNLGDVSPFGTTPGEYRSPFETFGSHGVSFGASDLSPESWQDGASYSEITPEAMNDLSQSIAEMFGEYGMDVHSFNGFENAAMTLGRDANLIYDQNFLWSIGQQYGSDAITGIAAHEVGHHVVETTLAGNESVSSWHHELCADFISGIVGQLHGVDHGVMDNMFADGRFAPPSEGHPNGGLRSQAYEMGVEWAQSHTNEVFSDILLRNGHELTDMFHSNIISKLPGSYGEYVNL